MLNWALSTWFTFDRIADPAYPDFFFERNWPFHFCTLVTIRLVPSVWLRSGPNHSPVRGNRNTRRSVSVDRLLCVKAQALHALHTLIFFPGTLAAFLVLFSPAVEYTGEPLWSMVTLFYVVHGLNVLIPFVDCALVYYRPRYRDALLSLVWFTVVGLVVLGVTTFARAFVDPRANSMYLFDPEGAGILEFLWDIIGVPVLYELPLLPLLAPVLLAMVAAHRGHRAPHPTPWQGCGRGLLAREAGRQRSGAVRGHPTCSRTLERHPELVTVCPVVGDRVVHEFTPHIGMALDLEQWRTGIDGE